MPSKDKDQPPKRICLGVIAAAHGVKGLVKIRPFAEDASLLNGTLYTTEQGPKTFTVTLKNSLGKYILAEIEGLHDRTEAENIRGTELYVERSALPDIEDGHYFEDLIGLKTLSEKGEGIGSVLSAENFGAGDLLDIQLKSGETFMLPFTDETVDATDISSGTITIKNYEKFIL